MTYRGDFDPSLFDQDDPTTWPGHGMTATVVAADTFDRADGPLTGVTPVGGQTWYGTAGIGIESNRVRRTGTGSEFRAIDVDLTNVHVSLVMADAPDSALSGPLAAYTSASQFIHLRVRDSDSTLYVGSTFGNVNLSGPAPVQGDRVGIRIRAGQITATINGTDVIGPTPLPADLVGTGYGYRVAGANVDTGTMDDFQVEDLDPEYRAGDWFYVTGPGTVNGDHVDVGFRVFPMATGRRYGQGAYGSGTYGGDPPAGPWSADPDVVWWRGRPWSDAPAWQRPPAPYDGAPFGDTGWRISVALWTADPAARRYGDLGYGDALYGDDVVPAFDWSDTACPVIAVVARRGGVDSTPFVDVDQISVELADHDAALFPLQTRATVAVNRGAGVGTPVRIALIDPAGDPWPIATGRIERIADRHDTATRTVVIDGVGMAVDLVRTLAVTRGTEDVADRLDALLALAGYTWGLDPYSGPSQTLRRIDPDPEAQLRELVDLTALSAGHNVATDPTGVVRFDPWPPVPRASGIAVTDRLGAAALAVVDADVVGDRDELLNLVTVESAEVQGAAAVTVKRRAAASVGQFGPSDSAIGFPLTGLSAQVADLETLADTVLARFGLIVNRVTRVAVDTWQDPRWLRVLTQLRIGDTVMVNLTKPVARDYTAVVVGTELRIDPGRIRADLYLSTTDPTI